MAITGNVFKKLTFAGSTSASFDVAITGEGVYNAPERDVEQVVIPGRNGELMLDNGRFQNIDIAYPACIAADSQADLADAISDFRNFLCSKIGYQRLEDDYNPDEYRMAIYKSGLEVSPKIRQAGSFEIIFNCKPQRFLKSGEAEVTIQNGDTIENPTLFDASPMLEIWGYGYVHLGSKSVYISGSDIGEIKLAKATYSGIQTFDETFLNAGDDIVVRGSKWIQQFLLTNTSHGAIVDAVGVSAFTEDTVEVEKYYSEIAYSKGTSRTEGNSYTFTLTFEDNATETFSVSMQLTYNGSGEIKLGPRSYGGWSGLTKKKDRFMIGNTYGISTITTAGMPAYIDLDLGEAYKEQSGEYVNLNSQVQLGDTLPVLPPGQTAITFSNTVTQLKIIPRWWKI